MDSWRTTAAGSIGLIFAIGLILIGVSYNRTEILLAGVGMVPVASGLLFARDQKQHEIDKTQGS